MITVLTRAYLRPKMLAKNVESLRNARGYEQLILEDKVGIGIAQTYVRLRGENVSGGWVWVLDDDNVLTDDKFFDEVNSTQADLIICKAKIGETVFPTKRKPALGHIDMMNVVVSRPLWYECRGDFGARYEGDFDFISKCYRKAQKIVRINRVIAKTQQISRGAPEWRE